MSNDRIPSNPYPVKPPPNMPAPKKESLETENARLKAEIERLTKAGNEISHAWSVYENGLIETPEWVKRGQVRDAISRLWNAAKEGKDKP